MVFFWTIFSVFPSSNVCFFREPRFRVSIDGHSALISKKCNGAVRLVLLSQQKRFCLFLHRSSSDVSSTSTTADSSTSLSKPQDPFARKQRYMSMGEKKIDEAKKAEAENVRYPLLMSSYSLTLASVEASRKYRFPCSGK